MTPVDGFFYTARLGKVKAAALEILPLQQNEKLLGRCSFRQQLNTSKDTSNHLFSPLINALQSHYRLVL